MAMGIKRFIAFHTGPIVRSASKYTAPISDSKISLTICQQRTIFEHCASLVKLLHLWMLDGIARFLVRRRLQFADVAVHVTRGDIRRAQNEAMQARAHCRLREGFVADQVLSNERQLACERTISCLAQQKAAPSSPGVR